MPALKSAINSIGCKIFPIGIVMRTDTARCVNSVLSVLTKKSKLTDYVRLELVTTKNTHISSTEKNTKKKKYITNVNILRSQQQISNEYTPLPYTTSPLDIHLQYPQIQMDVTQYRVCYSVLPALPSTTPHIDLSFHSIPK